MISQNVIRKIDKTIKEIWLNEIVEDYENGNDESIEEVIKWDIMKKMKDYIQSGNELCQYYFAVIYEEERSKLNWMRKGDIEDWANGFVTELDAGYINGEMWFEVRAYNGLNDKG